MGIVGTPVRPEVKKQLNQREQLYAGTSRGIAEIQGQNTTSWVRLASSVNIDGSSAKAKQFILFGGTEGSNTSIAVGTGNYFAEAYPFSKAQGHRPNPGIESLSFQYKNNGALATCDIDIKCYTFEQFNAIEQLYLRPGYSILVEWGHTKYITNEGKIESLKRGDVDGALTTFMAGGSSQVGQLINQIKNQREKKAFNYDGFFGKIVNFQWTFNKDLSYSITIKTITHGDIIEKLKINTATPESIQATKDELEKRKAQAEKDADGTSFIEGIGQGLGFVADQITSFLSGFVEAGTNLLGDLVDSVDDETWNRKLIAKRTKSQIHRVLFKILQKFPESPANKLGSGGIETLPESVNIATSSNATTGAANGQARVLETEAIRVAFDVSSADDQDLGNYQYYLTFGALLKVIEKTIYQDEEGLPIVRIDCEYGQTGMLTFPGQISADPLTCLIPHTVYPKIVGEGLSFTGGGISYPLLTDEALNKGFYPFDETNAVGDLMRVMLNFNYIMQVYEDTMDEDGNLALIDFIQRVLDDITLALGGINKFQTRVVDEGVSENISERRPTLSIYDEGAHIRSKKAESDSTVILKPYGVTSTRGTTFLDVSFSSELSNEFASQISIGAQANGNQPGENATAFSEFNKGLLDRMVKVKRAPDTTEDTVATKIAGTLLDLEEATNTLYGDAEVDKDVIKTAVSVNSTYAKYCIGELVTSNEIPPPFFIPFNLKIKMKGISGIRIFDKIRLEDDILPQSYRGKVAFILKGVNHEVSGNQWTTSLETLTVPDDEDAKAIDAAQGELQENEAFKKKQAKREQTEAQLKAAQAAQDLKNSNLGGGQGGGPSTVGPGTTLIRGLPYTAKYKVGTMPKTQITVHYTASSPKSSLALVVSGFNSRTDTVATHYVLDLDGVYDQLFPLREAWAWHLGVNLVPKDQPPARRDTDSAGLTGANFALFDKNLNHKAVGIEVCNSGMLKEQGGKYVDTLGSGYVYPDSEISKSVDKDGKQRAWHGFTHWHKFPKAQIDALEKLILDIISKEPEISPKGKPWKFNYDDCFPNDGKGNARTSANALKGVPGIYTHNSYSLRKSDVPPVPEIIAMFKRIEKKLASGGGSTTAEVRKGNCPNAYIGVVQLEKTLNNIATRFGYNVNKKTWINDEKKKEYSKEVIKVRNTIDGFVKSVATINKATDKANIDKGKKLENVIRNTWKGNAKAWAAWEFAGDGRGAGVKYKFDTFDNDFEDAVEAELDKILKPFNKDSNL